MIGVYAIRTTVAAHQYFTIDIANRMTVLLDCILADIFDNFAWTSERYRRLDVLKKKNPRDEGIIQLQEECLQGKEIFRRLRIEMFALGVTDLDLARNVVEIPAIYPEDITRKGIRWMWYFKRATVITAWRDVSSDMPLVERPLTDLFGDVSGFL